MKLVGMLVGAVKALEINNGLLVPCDERPGCLHAIVHVDKWDPLRLPGCRFWFENLSPEVMAAFEAKEKEGESLDLSLPCVNHRAWKEERSVGAATANAYFGKKDLKMEGLHCQKTADLMGGKADIGSYAGTKKTIEVATKTGAHDVCVKVRAMRHRLKEALVPSLVGNLRSWFNQDRE